jgi:hypothetical protein
MYTLKDKGTLLMQQTPYENFYSLSCHGFGKIKRPGRFVKNTKFSLRESKDKIYGPMQYFDIW